MKYSGDLPDNPPELTDDDRVRRLPFPVMTYVDQPSLIRLPGANFVERATRRGGVAREEASLVEASVSFNYTLQSASDLHGQPVREGVGGQRLSNMAPLQSFGDPVDWKGYPMLWEAVRTSWRDISEPAVSLPEQLVMHMDHC